MQILFFFLLVFSGFHWCLLVSIGFRWFLVISGISSAKRDVGVGLFFVVVLLLPLYFLHIKGGCKLINRY